MIGYLMQLTSPNKPNKVLFYRLLLTGLFLSTLALQSQNIKTSHAESSPMRARDAGIKIGILETGALNAITDVKGVKVGHRTLHTGTNTHTGVTVILPHDGNLMTNKVPAGLYVANGYGKMAGISQIMELGEIETPIALTNTLNVSTAMSGLIGWTLAQNGNENVRSVNAVVGETNDGYLNDIRARHITPNHVRDALNAAKGGLVEEGAVGAGAGTVAFGWKGGIGTSSRVLPMGLKGYTVGVLVQSNFGGVLNVDGHRVGEKLGQFFLKDEIDKGDADGSIMIVVATDAPLSDRNLTRLAKRAINGLARTGASMSNGSGDYVIAFSTHQDVRRTGQISPSIETPNGDMSALFQAVAEATEEAILNSLFMAVDVEGHRGTIKALPVDEVINIIEANK